MSNPYAHIAVVTEVIKGDGRQGVLVAYRDGSHLPGKDGVYVRVGSRRAHAQGGSDSELPQPGEMGVVLEIDESNFIWICSLHPDKLNQAPLDKNLRFSRHESGVREWTTREGDMGFSHPSGLKAWITRAAGPPVVPHGTATPTEVVTDPVEFVVDHPKAGRITLGIDGLLEVEHKSGGTITISPSGDLTFHGFGEAALGKFIMEPLFAWVTNHTHIGVQAGGGVSGIPQTPPPNSSLSPSKFQGPHA